MKAAREHPLQAQELEIFINSEYEVLRSVLQAGHHRSLLVVADPPLEEICLPPVQKKQQINQNLPLLIKVNYCTSEWAGDLNFCGFFSTGAGIGKSEGRKTHCKDMNSIHSNGFSTLYFFGQPSENCVDHREQSQNAAVQWESEEGVRKGPGGTILTSRRSATNRTYWFIRAEFMPISAHGRASHTNSISSSTASFTIACTCSQLGRSRSKLVNPDDEIFFCPSN